MAETEKRNPRLIKRGDIVHVPDTDVNEVVRAVSVVLHLANGQDVVFAATDSVEVVSPENPVTLEEVESTLVEERKASRAQEAADEAARRARG